ncbi:MAG TPA: hypothetical protein VME20_04165 [Acidimicrobiales bacterium]|nr:hypothetical protein [Acidimicrobiales bacterium]
MRIAVAGGTGAAGRHTIDALRSAGHDAVPLSRAGGVDFSSGAGLPSALQGAEVVIDTLNTSARKLLPASAFFTGAARSLQSSASAQGARRLVLLSIVGADKVPYGYYQAKVAQEAAALDGPLPVSIVRATQFHELAAQVAKRFRKGLVALAPRMAVQPVSAKSVGQLLAEVATASEAPAVTELAGPERAYLPDMAQALLHRLGTRVMVLPFSLRGDAGPAVQGGALLPGPGARIIGPSFEDWLAGDGPEQAWAALRQ